MNLTTAGMLPAQVAVLNWVGGLLTPPHFYLAGGTAVAIYYGHRRSVDLDWFTSRPLADPLQFAGLLQGQGVPFVTESTDQGTLHGQVNGIRVSFLEYHYPLLRPCVEWPEHSCRLASLDDLACMKLAAVAQRGLRKDFIDIYTLALHHKPLEELLPLYQEKYQTENILPVLMGLVYFEDADEEPDPPLWNVPWSEVKQKLAAWVRRI